MGKADAPIPLSNKTLKDMPDAVLRPGYDRKRLRPGIVHIGLGNFHRAHQAWYLHRLMQAGKAHDWAIVGAGVRPGDVAMRDRLLAQDGLTTLISLDPAGTSAEIIGAMVDFLPVEEDNAALVFLLSDPCIRIVSLTVTEGGYYQTASGALDIDHMDLRHDIAHPRAPRTAFGAIVAALAARRAAGQGPFTVQSCDNLQGNGDITRQVVVGLARARDADLADWIEAQVTFPNSMVDCIVPATGPAEIALAESFGIADAAPVTHETFRQWVIEDAFCAGRPPWEEVGATITSDVEPFERMKLRLLNAGHQVLANAGELLSLATIADCMADADLSAFFAKVVAQEFAPHVDPVPGMTPEGYITLISNRFSNPHIHDTTRRVAFDGSSRHSGFVLPVLRDALPTGDEIAGLALVEALWAHMCLGRREDGSEIAANDPDWDRLTFVARASVEDPAQWLAQPQVYGDLAENDVFTQAFVTAYQQIARQGVRGALQDYVNRP